jgi:hypothetical protein
MIALILQLWWVTNVAELRQTLAPQVQDQLDLEVRDRHRPLKPPETRAH